MHEFTAAYAGQIAGILSGFDRLGFRGTLRRMPIHSACKAICGPIKFCLRTLVHTHSRRAKSSKVPRWKP